MKMVDRKILILASFLISSFSFADSTYTVFNAKMDSLLSASLQKINFGIEVMNADAEQIIYSKNSESMFIPASNTKILTSLSALAILGPQYTFKTEVFYDDTNLYIKGYGNPELKVGHLDELADSVINYGLTEVNDIIYDNSYFDEDEVGSGWVYDPGSPNSSPKISALSLNKNCVELSVCPDKSNKIRVHPRTKYYTILDSTSADGQGLSMEVKTVEEKYYIILRGSSKEKSNFRRNVSNPPRFTATVFKELLEQKGVKIKGKLIKGTINTEFNPTTADSDSIEFCTKICSHSSAPLLHLIYYMNKNSDNFYAEHILKAVGAVGVGIPGSFEKGTITLYGLLRNIGLTTNDIRVFDGSGLSRYNLISPHGLVKVLSSAISKWGIRDEFISSLPLSGIDGTLKNRLRTNGCKGNIRAKTGTMLSVSSLSGYIYTVKNNLVIFAIMMDNYVLDTKTIKKIEDKIVELIIEEL